MDQMPVEMSQACISADSTVSMGQGVAWASEDGLCWYGAGGARVITAGILTREDWQAMNPATMTGQMYEGLYFGSYVAGVVRKGFMIDPINPTGVFFMDAGYEACYFDELKDQLYVLNGTNVQRWDAGTLMTTTAKSKVWALPSPVNMAVMQVVADAYPVQVQVFADGVQRADMTITGREPQWMPSGYLAMDWQVQTSTAGAVQGISMATTIDEIQQS